MLPLASDLTPQGRNRVALVEGPLLPAAELAVARDRINDAVGSHRAHAIVARVADVEGAVGTRGDAAGVAETGANRPAAVAGIADFGIGAGDEGEDASAIHLDHPELLVVGDEDVPGAIDGHAAGNE